MSDVQDPVLKRLTTGFTRRPSAAGEPERYTEPRMILTSA